MIENKWIYIIIIIIIIVVIIVVVFSCRRKENDCDDNKCDSESNTSLDSDCDENKPHPKPDCEKPKSPKIKFRPIGFVQRKSDNNFEADIPQKEHVKPDIVVLNPSIEKSTSTLKELISKHIGDIESTSCEGIKIAIVSAYINPNIKKDLYHVLSGDFKCAIDLKNRIENDIIIVNENQNCTKDHHAWNLQQTMEVQVLAKLCPGAKIYLLQAKSSHIEDMLSAVQFACDPTSPNEDGVFGLGVHVVNLSWGGDISCLNENDEIFAGSCRADQIFADYPNVIFSSSTGNIAKKTQWPSINPYVIACGGLEFKDSKIQGWASSGSGSDEEYPSNPATGSEFRTVPDVASFANPLNGVTVHHNGVEVVVGGTALSCTLFTAFISILNARRLKKGMSLLNQNILLDSIYNDHELFKVENAKYDPLTGMGLFSL